MTDHKQAEKEALSLLGDMIARSRAAGAEAADAVLFEGTSLSVWCRLGEVDDVKRSEGRNIGLRVFFGQQQAIVSSSDASPSAIDQLVERAIAMAKAAPEDPFCGLGDKALMETAPKDLDLFDAQVLDAEALKARALEAEDAARAIEGVTNSEGAGADFGVTTVALANSEDFAGAYTTSSHSGAVSVVAGIGTEMERDYAQRSAHHLEDLDAPAELGRRAGERAVRRLYPHKKQSAQVPVVYHPRVGNGLLGHFASAITGSAVARGTSFLKDKMGEAIFADTISIVDDPHIKRGRRSKPFDGEGGAGMARNLIEQGNLTTWLMDSASARQLGLASTGHASRGTSGPPGPASSNLYLEAGNKTPDELMADIVDGLFITELIGFGVNGVTGDYSRGAAGFWIENGKIAYPVSELTVAGNLVDMFRELTPADDLEFNYGTNVPTLRIDGMTVAGT